MFVIRAYPPDIAGGGARSVSELAQALVSRGHEIHVVRLAPKAELDRFRAAAEEETRRTGVIVHVLPLRNLYWPFDWQRRRAWQRTLWHIVDLYNVAAARDIARLVRAVRPHIVNTSIIAGFSTAIFKAAKGSGAKVVHTLRDYYLLCGRSSMHRAGHNCTSTCWQCRPFLTVRKRTTRWVDLFLSNSDFVTEVHRKHAVFPEGAVCLRQWNINPRQELPPKRHETGQPRTFGFIGRLAPSKGVESMLEAANTLDQEGAWELLIAGTGDERWEELLKARFAGNHRIRFIGWQDAEDFYSKVDVVICPSTYQEPLPRVIYEAFGHGIPVIAANAGGIPEIVRTNVNGVLYDAGDVQALRSAMIAMLKLTGDDYRRLSVSAWAQAEAFLPDRVVVTYESRMYRLLCGHPPGAGP